MKILNQYNLPESLLRAISYDEHKGEGYSITELISPPRILQLRKRHAEEIKVDASERIWLLLGNAVHYILAKGKIIDSLVEEKLEAVIDGVAIRGRPDFLHEETILDYKVSSVWNAIYAPEGRREYTEQLNLYRYLYREEYKFPVNHLQICMILRDWQKSKVSQANYPPIPIKMIDVPIWDISDTLKFLWERISQHVEASKLLDDSLPFCTAEEIWEKPGRYAIIKYGAKRAIKVLNTREEANNILKDMAKVYSIEERLGERTRCKSYCEVASFCNQWKDLWRK